MATASNRIQFNQRQFRTLLQDAATHTEGIYHSFDYKVSTDTSTGAGGIIFHHYLARNGCTSEGFDENLICEWGLRVAHFVFSRRIYRAFYRHILTDPNAWLSTHDPDIFYPTLWTQQFLLYNRMAAPQEIRNRPVRTFNYFQLIGRGGVETREAALNIMGDPARYGFPQVAIDTLHEAHLFSDLDPRDATLAEYDADTRSTLEVTTFMGSDQFNDVHPPVLTSSTNFDPMVVWTQRLNFSNLFSPRLPWHRPYMRITAPDTVIRQHVIANRRDVRRAWREAFEALLEHDSTDYTPIDGVRVRALNIPVSDYM